MTQPDDVVSVAVVPELQRFPQQLRAGVDAAMRGLVQQIERALRDVEREATETANDVSREFRTSATSSAASLRVFAQSADASLERVNRQATVTAAGIATKMRGAALAAAGAIAGIGAVLAAAIGGIAFFGLKGAAQLEQIQVGFESLLGSAGAAQQFVDQLQQFATKTPFAFLDVASISQRLLVLAQNLGRTKDAVIPMLTVIGDLGALFAATPDQINSVIRALSQISSKGRVQQEEILQIAEAFPVFNANAAIAAKLGVPVSEAMKLIASGSVDAKTAIDAIIEGMANYKGAAGAMQKQSETLVGVLSTFKDVIQVELTKAFQPVVPEIKKTITEITPLIGQIAQQVGPAVGGLITAILPLAAKLLNALSPIFTQVIGFITDFVSMPGLGDVFTDWGKAGGQVLAAFKPLIPVIGKLIGAFATGMVPVIEALLPILGELVPVIVSMLEAFIPILPSVLELAAALVSLLLPVAQLANLLLVDTHLVDALSVVIGVLATFIGGAADAIGELGKWLKSIDWGSVGDAIGGFFVGIFEDAKQFFGDITKRLKAIPGQAQAAFTAFRDAAVARLMASIQFVKELPGKIVAALGNLAQTLVQQGKDLVVGLFRGMAAMGGWLVGKIKSFITDNIIGTVTDALGISSPSRVMADEVGRHIPTGIAQGIGEGITDLDSILGDLTARMVNQTNHTALTISMGGVHFHGRQPTEDEARKAGAAVMQGATSDVDRLRGVLAAVRMA